MSVLATEDISPVSEAEIVRVLTADILSQQRNSASILSQQETGWLPAAAVLSSVEAEWMSSVETCC